MQKVTLWNPKTGEKHSTRSAKVYDDLIEKGWEVLFFPPSDLKYL